MRSYPATLTLSTPTLTHLADFTGTPPPAGMSRAAPAPRTVSAAGPSPPDQATPSPGWLPASASGPPPDGATGRQAVDLQAATISTLGRAKQHLSELADARLDEANLTGAGLFATDLTDAWFAGVNLTRADLPSAKLAGANLGRMNLATAANLTQHQLDSARSDDYTKLAAGL